MEQLENSLQALLTNWFGLGFLRLQSLSWGQSSVGLIERIIQYEAVHPIGDITEMKRRLGRNRRIYGFFHERLPQEPLVFVEVALMHSLPSSIHHVLEKTDLDVNERKSELENDRELWLDDFSSSSPSSSTLETRRPKDDRSITHAIFYSITSPHKGLSGIDLGNFLIKRVAQQLSLEFPLLRSFATLSPLPGFRKWLDQRCLLALSSKQPSPSRILNEEEVQRLLSGLAGENTRQVEDEEERHKRAVKVLGETLARAKWVEEEKTKEVLEPVMKRLAAQYLVKERRRGLALDPVANFHLRNGAQVHRINWLGNCFSYGLDQSASLMVNYWYDLDSVEKNNERYIMHGEIASSPLVSSLLSP